MKKNAPPNILLFLTDQHRLSGVGCYGPTPCRTPNIDRLAAEGIRFTNAYTSCPVCSPARATIMTGQHLHAHGVSSNVHNLSSAIHELEDRPQLLSRRLQAAGYRLGYSGKWHLGTDRTETFGGTNRPSLPRDVGFEGQDFPGHGNGGFRFPEYLAYLREHGYEHEVLPWDHPAEPALPGRAGELAGPVESTVPHFLAENTISLIDRFRSSGGPFFIWHNNWGPHTPHFAARPFVDMYRDVEIPPWPNYRWPSRQIPGPHHAKIHPRHEDLSWDSWAWTIRHYYAFVSMIDDQIGRVLRHLDDTGLASNTVVVFTADHGETLGSHGGLTDKGWHHFEETHHIPLIVRLPYGVGGGTTRDALVSLADIYPTICEMAGASYDREAVHGQSLLPLTAGKTDEWRDHVVTEFGGVNSLGMTQRTLRVGHLKYGYNGCCSDELYDLERDPWEMTNLIDAPGYRQAGRDMRARLAEWMGQTNDPVRHMFVQQKVGYYDG